MAKPIITLVICFFTALTLTAAPYPDSAYTESPISVHTSTGDLFGTLTLPGATSTATAVALIIAGSGPTDRNGNNPLMKNESLRKLAYSLAENQIASVRFDKRGVGESNGAAKKEADLRFEDYIDDARSWISLLKGDKRFSRVWIIGHSEGSLIGMVAAHRLADGFISVAGAGTSADKLLRAQLGQQPQQVRDLSLPILDSLVLGRTVTGVPPLLFSLFRPSVQPYLISWFRYDPALELKKLTIPVLIVQGTKDLQVTVEDARLLAKANPRAQLLLIPSMNHLFIAVKGDENENAATYYNPSLPIIKELIHGIATFIKKG